MHARGLLISPKRTNALMKGIMRIIGMLPKLTVISKLFGRSVSHARGEERDKMTFCSSRFALSSRLSPFAWKTITTENACSAGYLPNEIPWIREKCQLISVLLYAFPFVIFSPSLLTCFDVKKTSFVVAQIRVSIKHIFWRQLDYLFITYLSEGFYCFDSSDASDNVMVNFTLVFFKGNKTVDELHQVLEKSVENGSVYSLPVQRGTLRLTLISEFTILCCTERCPINYCKTKT